GCVGVMPPARVRSTDLRGVYVRRAEAPVLVGSARRRANGLPAPPPVPVTIHRPGRRQAIQPNARALRGVPFAACSSTHFLMFHAVHALSQRLITGVSVLV